MEVPITIIDYWDEDNIFELKKLWKRKKVVVNVKRGSLIDNGI
jgi:hypothetical protein